ncbi:MAG: hypothetical protein WCX93_06140 [Burkholderiaceae bacterium]
MSSPDFQSINPSLESINPSLEKYDAQARYNRLPDGLHAHDGILLAAGQCANKTQRSGPVRTHTVPEQQHE